MTTKSSDATMAVFLDLENIALGARDAKYPSFDIKKVLERLLLKGHIVVKKAYCDFDRYKEFKRGMHEAAFELIEIPHVRQSGKNSADIRMVVDALDLCYTKAHVDTFVIFSGDSDFSPLVSKLRENDKTRHRRGRQELDLRPVHRQLRRVHLLRRPGAQGTLQNPPAFHSAPACRGGPRRIRIVRRIPSSAGNAPSAAGAASTSAGAADGAPIDNKGPENKGPDLNDALD